MFQIEVRSMPSLQSFAACKQWYEQTKKPKGVDWKENERPLDSVRMHHKRIVLNSAGGYELTLYRTPLVTYWPDGTVTVHLHDSRSSQSFLGRMLPGGLAINTKSRILLSVDTDSGVRWVQAGPDGVMLERAEYNRWRIINEVEQRRREFVNRQKSSDVRKTIKPFLTWYRAASKIIPFEKRHFGSGTALSIFDVTKTEDWPKLAEFVHNEEVFRDRAYDYFGAREVLPIPDDTPPRRGRSWALT